jgi:type I restriction enzyme R subunit
VKNDSHSRHNRASQYFRILNSIEHVIRLDAKFSEASFLFFWRKFNVLYNQLHRSNTPERDPIEVYFDNQIGIIEPEVVEIKPKMKKPPKVVEGKITYGPNQVQLNILDIIAARNEEQEKTGVLIQQFASKILDFFDYVQENKEGERLIVKMKSHVAEDEIYDEFARIYRRYRIFNQKTVGEYFFEETKDLVNKLCDDFEAMIVQGK